MGHRRRRTTRLAFLLPLCAHALAPGAPAQEMAVDAQFRALSATHWTMIVETGAVIVESVAEARAELARGNADRARNELGKARKLLQAIRRTSPAARVDDRIAEARQKLHAGGTRGVDLAPIYAELDGYERMFGNQEIRRRIDEARDRIESDPQGAAEALEAASEQLVMLEIDGPLEHTDAKVTAALVAIEKQDLADADAALASAQHHLEIFATIVAAGTDPEQQAPPMVSSAPKDE